MIEYYPERITGLGAACPEGSSTKYTGPEGPNGCRCSTGRVWHDGRCQSPQAIAQQAGASAEELTKQYGTGSSWATQPLSASARSYLEKMGATVSCKIIKGAQTPAGAAEWMACSINGSPFQYGAYALNTNPGVALVEMRTQQAQEVAAATPGTATYGAAPGSGAFSSPEGAKAVSAAREALKAQYGGELVPPDAGYATPPAPVNVIGGPGNAPIAPAVSGNYPVPPDGAAPPGSNFFSMLPPVVSDEWIAGVPNWLLLVAAAGAGYVAFKN